jgi:uroporphyrinogen-III synthase
MPDRLDGQVILNTRPAHQQAALTALLEADGARVLSFPAIEIELHAPSDLAQRLEAFDVLLFVSRNAVDGAFCGIDAQRLPPATRLGVIGSATRAALLEYVGDRDVTLVADPPFNSEALLAAPELERMDGKRVAIFRGQAGRNLLGDELTRRGAEVAYFEVYRRRLPRVETAAFDRLVEAEFPSLVILTSDEGMHNLLRLVDAAAAARLCATPWLLISERMRESALKLGHNAAIVIAGQASDDGIHRSVRAWANP